MFQDETKGEAIKRLINDHMADNLEPYYFDKISYPYEAIIFGEPEKIVINNHTEMKTFLRSDRSLRVYSSTHELIAIANMFNINIHIFTYEGENAGYWNIVKPDPDMEMSNIAKLGFSPPDMALYHKKNDHYDLLVDAGSRFASPIGSILFKMKTENVENKEDVSKNVKKTKTEEKVVPVNIDQNEGNDTEIPMSNKLQNFLKCYLCQTAFESQQILDLHLREHSQTQQYSCDHCDLVYEKKLELELHNIYQHESHTSSENWSCNDHDFQADTENVLLKHLTHTLHQPNPSIRNRKSIFLDYKQCYTCDLEFEGFKNLMRHRKAKHPSNKKCKNLEKGCTYGVDCWYVHEEDLMETDESNDNFGNENYCHVCKADFVTKNNYMKHKKKEHTDRVAICEHFLKKRCTRKQDILVHTY